MDPANLDLAQLLAERSYQEGEFVLASGRASRHYFDCRLTTCFAAAMPLVARAFIREFQRAETHPRAVGGMTSGADPIALAVSHHSASNPPAIDAFIVRKERKEHGTQRWIEGCVGKGDVVAVVEDVVTSGKSALTAIERCQAEGLQIVRIVALVDRQEGGLEAIRAKIPGIPASAIFTLAEIEALRRRERAHL